jgi:hypothetical protein
VPQSLALVLLVLLQPRAESAGVWTLAKAPSRVT